MSKQTSLEHSVLGTLRVDALPKLHVERAQTVAVRAVSTTEGGNDAISATAHVPRGWLPEDPT